MQADRPRSKSLPERASLEHLKNEAKARLKAMRAQTSSPPPTLAAAQLAVARDYGFASWRKLKAYVDAVRAEGAQLIHAVRSGDVPAIAAVLDRHPELVDATTDADRRVRPSDTRAMRLVHLAVSEGQIEVVRLLVERGADLDVRNADGRLPLHDCFELGRDEMLPILMAGGARPDACAAAAWGMLDRLVEILERDPGQANDMTTGMPPLGWAAFGDQPEAARILFRHGAVIDRPPQDRSAWRAVSMVAQTALARVFLDHGADPSCPDDEGDTPLHLAIRSRLVADPTAFVELLLGAGADPETRNRAGLTPLDVALEQADRTAETYFPPRPLARKTLDRVIALLRRDSGSRPKTRPRR
jgi:Ankyrin repeats (3 copies)/Ankyrin repeat